MRYKHAWAIALTGFGVAALPLASASAGNLDLMPKGDWAVKLAGSELGELRGAGFGIAFDIAVSGSIENLSGVLGPTANTPPPGFSISASNGIASVTTTIGGINGNGIFIFNQVPGNLNVINTTVVVNVAISNFGTP